MGAIENMGELQYGRIASHTPLRQLADFAPYDTRKKPHANINVQ